MTGWLMVGVVALFGLGCDSSLSSPTSGLSAGGAGGQAAVTIDASGDALVCHDELNAFHDGGPPVARCCPDPAPDCTNEPDGYPGYFCVSRDNQYCSCSCQQHAWSCGC
jgi:hypothetical protein